MARFLPLIFSARKTLLGAAAMASFLTMVSPLEASPATNAAPKPVPPPEPPDTLGQYGNILVPGTEMDHPIKLALPIAGVGEVKIPSQNELNMRDKLEGLATLSDDEIRTRLAAWPPFSKMSLRDEGAMLQRIQDFRDHRSKMAQQMAHRLGLLTLTPPQQAKFENEYWDKWLKMNRELAKQFEPILNQDEQKLQEELFREFSATHPGATPPSATQVKKPSPSPAAVAQVKPVAPSSNSPPIGANSMAPTAQ